MMRNAAIALMLAATCLASPVEAGQREAVPAGNPADWITNDDYPPEALRADESGRVSLRIDVDVNGMPARCTIVESSHSAALDEAGCRALMARSRFVPGVDQHGRPVATQYKRNIIWRLPAGEGDGTMTTVSFATDFVPRRCVLTLRGKPRHLTPEICNALMAAVLDNGGSIEQPVRMSVSDGMLAPE